ncbi:MAG: iron ABC transporter permease, partial [Pseudomonadota bacterium]
AAQLALCLLTFALLIAMLERAQRGRARVAMKGGRLAGMERVRLGGAQAWAVSLACAVPVAIGFVIPVIVLGEMAIDSGQSLLNRRYLGFMTNSLMLASVAAVVTVAGAVLIGYRARLIPGRTSRALVIAAGLGYAVPGGVIAVGLMVPFASLDNALDAWMRETFGVRTGLLITGSIWLMVIAYMGRFMAAALNTYDAGMAGVQPTMDAVARTLGRSTPRILWGVHLPIVRGSVLTALLIVFVDVMKELPATLILRPFNYDTLAVQAHRLASDERLDQAAVPSLVIVAFGLLPVILLCRRLGRAEPG